MFSFVHPSVRPSHTNWISRNPGFKKRKSQSGRNIWILKCDHARRRRVSTWIMILHLPLPNPYLFPRDQRRGSRSEKIIGSHLNRTCNLQIQTFLLDDDDVGSCPHRVRIYPEEMMGISLEKGFMVCKTCHHHLFYALTLTSKMTKVGKEDMGSDQKRKQKDKLGYQLTFADKSRRRTNPRGESWGWWSNDSNIAAWKAPWEKGMEKDAR